MFPVSTMAGGMAQGVPDVCKVLVPPAPPIPTPFPNIVQFTQAVGTTMTVKVMGMGCLNKNSQVPMSMGDNAGVGMGVSAPFVMGPLAIKMGSTKLKLEGADAVLQLKTTSHNGSNPNFPAGTVVAPSQTKFFCIS